MSLNPPNNREDKFTVVVLPAAGAFFESALSIIERLHEKGRDLNEADLVVGTSMGGIQALFFSLPTELRDQLMKSHHKDFQDNPAQFFREYIRPVLQDTLYTRKRDTLLGLFKYLAKQILGQEASIFDSRKFIESFQDFFRIPDDGGGHRELTMGDLNTRVMIAITVEVERNGERVKETRYIANFEDPDDPTIMYCPDLPLWQVAAMTAAIPYAFSPITLEHNGEIMTVCDGGVAAYTPARKATNTAERIKEDNQAILGLVITSGYPSSDWLQAQVGNELNWLERNLKNNLQHHVVIIRQSITRAGREADIPEEELPIDGFIAPIFVPDHQLDAVEKAAKARADRHDPELIKFCEFWGESLQARAKREGPSEAYHVYLYRTLYPSFTQNNRTLEIF